MAIPCEPYDPSKWPDHIVGEEGHIYTAAQLQTLLNERDDFIVAKGLWAEFVASITSK